MIRKTSRWNGALRHGVVFQRMGQAEPAVNQPDAGVLNPMEATEPAAGRRYAVLGPDIRQKASRDQRIPRRLVAGCGKPAQPVHPPSELT
ncbi:hypothetical protein ACQP0I_04730 [Micromonospora carbonacea]|uniref:hypothetical protein n=1 Tax=Micromonospora carbonacea TaxID=47853 RepID=UPI003D9533F5